MKPNEVVLGLLLLATGLNAEKAPGPLQISTPDGQPQIALPWEPIPPVGGTKYLLRIESSTDLRNWTHAGELTRTADGTLAHKPGSINGWEFFRLRPQITESDEPVDGAGLSGFHRVFGEELRRVGYVTPEQFAASHPQGGLYLPRISFDPRSAKFWDAFNADPAVVNQGLPTNSPDWRSFDFRLNPEEMGLFLTNGFVVSERLGRDRFAEVFYRIFNDDLPVFVSADSVLHAWHFSYAHMLSELEQTHLALTLRGILDGMATELAKTPDSVRQGPLGESLKDADYFLAVARSLSSGFRADPVLGPDPHVARTLTAIANAEQYLTPPGFEMFGTNRLMDFSQFNVRGYYTRSIDLGYYFKAFMWTARIDLRILETDPSPQSLRELGTAAVLSLLLDASGQARSWTELDSLLSLFVGRTDAMTFAQLKPLLDAAGIRSLNSITSAAQLAALQQGIVNGGLGLQLIPGDAYVSPFGPEQVQLPRAFVLTGQRFVPDGWTLANVTFDRILWPEDVPGMTVFGKVLRRVPSALDAAYAVLGNREIGLEIAQRMLAPRTAGNFRDGFPYAHNLEALAATFDRMNLSAWQDSIYTRWLYALRALSVPTTNSSFPEAMRTRAWTLRSLNTQLASYTELKHDTVLYAKQPYASSFVCEYPAGFIEPVPEFWRRMREMAEETAAGLTNFPIAGAIGIILLDELRSISVDLGQRHAARINFCTNFAAVMATLEEMANKELRQEPFTPAETEFIRGLMNRQDHGYLGPTFDGWYPGLYYKDYALQTGTADENGSNKADALVADIFTAPPDLIDPVGGVLHEATGGVDMLLIAIDNGPDRMVYAGPVMSHYEFLVPGPVLKRLTDSDWGFMTPRPDRPDWTKGYLVPKR